MGAISAVRLGSLLVARRVVDDIRRGERAGQLFVADFDLVEAFKHRSFLVLGLDLACNVIGQRRRSYAIDAET